MITALHGSAPMEATAGGSRPRVLHVMDSLCLGGTERVVLRLIADTRHRFDHFVCCIREPGGHEETFRAAGGEVTVIGKRQGHDWRVPWRIGRLCRELRPHIVHTRNWGAIEGVVAGRVARVPVVIHGEHGSDSAERSAAYQRRARVRRLLLPLVDRVVVVSSHLEHWLVEEIGIPKSRVTLIANGVDHRQFQPTANRDRIRHELGYGAQHLVVGALGRLHPIKNHVTLVAAFDAVRRDQPDARLVIVGDGPERRALEHEVARRHLRDTVLLAGEHNDVRPWLAAMDIFAQPSLLEGSSNAILEAMSAGLPVIATHTGGTPDLVHDGISGRLVAPMDTFALAAAIRAYGASPEVRAAHGRAGRQTVLDHYSVERMVRDYVHVYDQALRQRGLAGVDTTAARAPV